MPFRFAWICDLLEALEAIETNIVFTRSQKQAHARASIRRWFSTHEAALHSSTTTGVAVLSALLPERRTDRVYGLGVSRLKGVLGRSLRMGHERASKLSSWTESSRDSFPKHVAQIHASTEAGQPAVPWMVEEADALLNELAANCRFSSPSIRAAQNRCHPDEILGKICPRLRARELKWLLHLVLKSFAPVDIDDALVLQSFHPMLPSILTIQPAFDAALPTLRNIEDAGASSGDVDDARLLDIVKAALQPQVGTKIARPDFDKARSVKHCLQLMQGGKWSIEQKYDGEYCQIHVDLAKGDQCIQIFSKSNKDSTEDKQGAHAWIKAALRIGQPGCGFKRSCILEGELLLSDKRNGAILPFHKIRKHIRRSGRLLGTEQDSQPHRFEQLIVLFYDMLALDGQSLLLEPYEQRRGALKFVVHQVGKIRPRVDWRIFDMDAMSCAKHARTLEKGLAASIAKRFEGLVLKSCKPPEISASARGFWFRHARTIKFKKDYIPGVGDSADFAIVGARFALDSEDAGLVTEKKIKWTHFLLGCLVNKQDVVSRQVTARFQVVAELCRPCIPLETMKELSDHGQFAASPHRKDQDHRTCQLEFPLGYKQPDVVFRHPFVAEVVGSSFVKPPSSCFWMLRHPRIIKIHHDRSFEDAVGFDELQALAEAALEVPHDILAEEQAWLQKLCASAMPKRTQGPAPSSPAWDRSSTPSDRPATLQDMSPLLAKVTKSARRAAFTGQILADATSEHNLDTPAAPLNAPRQSPTVANAQRPPNQLVSPACSFASGPDAGDDTACARCNDSPRRPSSLPRKRPLEPSTDDRTAKRHKAPSANATLSRPFSARGKPHPSSSSPPAAAAAAAAVPPPASLQTQPSPHPFVPPPSLQTPPTANDTMTPLISPPPLRRRHSIPSMKKPTARVYSSSPTAYVSPPLESVVVYIPPTLLPPPRPPRLEKLLQRAQDVTTNLSDWIRDIGPIDPKGEVVGESQAWPGFQKVVLLEWDVSGGGGGGGSGEAVMQDVRDRVKLGLGETVEFWDASRVLAAVVDNDEAGSRLRGDECVKVGEIPTG